jgi:hypothetical protein
MEFLLRELDLYTQHNQQRNENNQIHKTKLNICYMS